MVTQLGIGEMLRQVGPVRALASHHLLEFGAMLAHADTQRGMQRRAGDLGREVRLNADSDEGGHPFQSHRGHHSNLMAARPDHPRRSILLMSWSGNQGQAEARSLRRLSPLSSMRWAAWTTRSRTASARVGSPTISYQRPIGTWLVMISEPVL